jgi:pimeloyl-ACP methyl ester carboxylesterase
MSPMEASVVQTFVDREDGSSVFIEAWGASDAPGLLILDGIGCSGWAFRRIVPRLAERHRVALMHYRGHGRSPNPSRPWHLGMHELADDAAAALTALGIESAVVLGFSMGFQVALELYKRHRPRVDGLVSLAGPSGRVLASFQGTEAVGHLLPVVRAATKLAEDWTLKIWRRVLPSNALKWIGLQTQLNVDRIDMGDIELYLTQMARMSPELFVEMLGEAARHCSDDLLSRVRAPALIVAGGGDRFVPLPTMRRVAFSIPNASWVVIPAASHALPAEYPEEIVDHVLNFTSGLASASAP